MDFINGLIKENIKETGRMENNTDLESTLLLKENQEGKKSLKLNTGFGKMENEFLGLQMNK